MLIKAFTVGYLQTNCYIVTDENTLECAVIDPGAESGRLLDYIEDNKLKVRYIFLTHGHYDHTMAVEELSAETGAKIYIHKKDFTNDDPDAPYKLYSTADVSHYGEGHNLKLGGLEFTVLETPGHSEGSVTLMCENALFTGDTLFRDSCGRTDLEGGSMQILMESLKRLYFLDGDYEVYPGHADSTTLSRERRFNEYMKYAVKIN